jgi:hypothetical protein
MPVQPNRPMNRVTKRQFLITMSLAAAAVPFAGAASPQAQQGQGGWESLFDGKTLGKWKKTEFGGEGDVTIDNGEIVMAAGNDMTGITWTGEVPTENFEVEVKARRLSGNDFFCGLTFPVGKLHCSFIAGGWAGAVCGLSTLDGEDASGNDTMRIRDFETARWYTVRVRVTVDRIQAWIDDEVFADVKTAGRRIGIRPEVDMSRPLGVASWRTKAGLRDLRLRRLTAI